MKAYNPKNIPLAKQLRKEMTPWEKKLWYAFLSEYPIRFQRQKAIGEYIVDFYCAKAQLVVELDGKWHSDEDAYLYDKQRTEQIESMGLSVMRFRNADVYRDFKHVCEKIDAFVQANLQGKNTDL